jgi:hypothetical protein
LPAAGVELDSSQRTATRHGHPLDLSVKEFAMLEALMRARPPAVDQVALKGADLAAVDHKQAGAGGAGFGDARDHRTSLMIGHEPGSAVRVLAHSRARANRIS